MVEDVAHLLRILNIDRLHACISVSMGAAMGIYFATRHPGVVLNLAICDTIPCSPGNAGTEDVFAPRVAAARLDGNLCNAVERTLQRWLGENWMGVHVDETARLRSLMLESSLEGFETCCHALRSDTFDFRPLLFNVGNCVERVVCVVGEKDGNLPQSMDEMRQEVEDGFAVCGKGGKVELVVIQEAGHVCFIEGLGQFSQVITKFLEI